jgi:general secretion pathway protein A
MDYYKILNFEMEPFSNSPDPGLFYNSVQHLEALQKLEISIRLKRGLNVVTGDIGTGKTTLSRQLIQKISNDESIKFYLVLDPGFSSTVSFLKYLLHLFQPEKEYSSNDENVLKEIIKEHIFTYGVDKNINIVFIIDEGQKLSLSCIEILRELLNFETNDQKLIQIIILAQKEFDHSLEQVVNFQDRVNFYYRLNPLNFKDSKRLIDYRLDRCFVKGKNTTLFTPFAYFLIYMATKGFPRKIVTLCHQIMLSLIIKNKSKADFFFVRSCIKKVFPKKRMVRPGFLFTLLFVLIIGILYTVNENKIMPVFDQFSYFDQKSPQTKKSNLPIKIDNTTNTNKKEKFNPSELSPDIKIVIPEKKEKKDLKNPKNYGSIKVPKNATLARMMRIIYGSFRYSYLDKLIKYNSNLTDPNTVKAGMKINFPVLRSSEKLDDKKIFIVIFESDNFEKSFAKAHNYLTPNFNVRILPVWRKDKGFFFPVVINKTFVSMTAAKKYKKRLPEIISAECKLVSQMKNNEKKQKG